LDKGCELVERHGKLANRECRENLTRCCAHRQSRSINYRISSTRLPMLKDLDSFVFADTPVNEGAGPRARRRLSRRQA
jgi:hypothetical protein